MIARAVLHKHLVGEARSLDADGQVVDIQPVYRDVIVVDTDDRGRVVWIEPPAMFVHLNYN